MSIQTIYPFNIPTNYTYDYDLIEVTGGKAQLVLQQTSSILTEDFADDTGFTYDDTKAEFVGGQIQQKLQATFGADYTSDINGSFGLGILTGTATGGASVTSGKLDLSFNDVRYVDYDANLNADSQQTICIRLNYTPKYTGAPLTHQEIFSLARSQSPTIDTDNLILLRHLSNGSFNIAVLDENEMTLFNYSTPVWSQVNDQEYELELNVDITSGATRLFVDGVQIGTTQTGTGIRSSNIGSLRIGNGSDGTATSLFLIDNFTIFDSVQHTANYTPGTFPSFLYSESGFYLPNLQHTGPGTIIQITSMDSIESGIPHYTISLQNGPHQYWDGTAWVGSDETYAQGNPSATFNTNLPTLDMDTTTKINIHVHFGDTNTLMSIDNIDINYIEHSAYDINNPTIKPTTVNADALDAFAEVINTSGADLVKYTIEVSGVEKYWNGTIWATSSGYAQSNTATEINTNASSLDLSLGVKIRPVIYLHSDDGSTTPNIDTLTIDYDFFGGNIVSPDETIVYGTLIDVFGAPIVNAYVIVDLINSDTHKTLNYQVSLDKRFVRTNSVGYWEISVLPTATLSNGKEYRFTFLDKSENLILQEFITVPDQVSVEFNELSCL